MTRILIPRGPCCSSKLVASTDFENYFSDILNCHITTGLCISAQCPNILAVNLSTGHGRQCGLWFENTTIETVTCLAMCDTTFVYVQLNRDGSCRPCNWTLVTNLTGCAPAESQVLGTATTNATTVTSVCNILRETRPIPISAPTGTAWPTCPCPVHGDVFTRTDLGVTATYWDGLGCAWLCTPISYWSVGANGIPRCMDLIRCVYDWGDSPFYVDDFTNYATACVFHNYWSDNDVSGVVAFSAACNEIQFNASGSGQSGLITFDLGKKLCPTWILRFEIVGRTSDTGACASNWGWIVFGDKSDEPYTGVNWSKGVAFLTDNVNDFNWRMVRGNGNGVLCSQTTTGFSSTICTTYYVEVKGQGISGWALEIFTCPNYTCCSVITDTDSGAAENPCGEGFRYLNIGIFSGSCSTINLAYDILKIEGIKNNTSCW